MPPTYYRVLTIAGSDSGGGAGIQADLKTFAALGCYGMSAITALTAQNTVGVDSIHAVPPVFVEEQIESVLNDIGADAIKIGMLFSAAVIEAVARQLLKHRAERIVIDPVMVAQSGDKLLQDDAIEAVKACLLPLADVATPNLPEAEVLVGRPVRTMAQMRDAARQLASYGSRSLLLKGGHGQEEQSTDLLFLCEQQRFVELSAERIATTNSHGTGCTLSSAIAAYLARGESLEEAVRQAKAYLTAALRSGAGYRLGKGSGPVHHFYGWWQ
jgi:hydroxymethylpyrimidine/phosphomethylpyrimidine kinase